LQRVSRILLLFRPIGSTRVVLTQFGDMNKDRTAYNRGAFVPASSAR
jgi:hypothetical protein